MKSINVNIEKYFLKHNSVLIVITGLLFYIFQYLNQIGYVMIFITSVFIILFYIKGWRFLSLFLLFLYSFFTEYGNNIYNFKIYNISLFYFIIAALFILSLSRIRSLKINRSFFYYILLSVFVILRSMPNIFYSEINFFLRDVLVIVIIPFMFAIIYKDLNIEELISLFYYLAIVHIIATIILFIFNIGLSERDYFAGVLKVDNYDELSIIYFLLVVLSLLLRKKYINPYFVKWTYLLSLIIIVGLYKYKFSFLNIGTQHVVLLVILIILNHRKIKISACVGLVIFILLVHNLMFSDMYTIVKINNLIDSIKILIELNWNTVDELPHSVYVRVVEISNILSYPWYNILFGHGIGGYFEEIFLEFKILGKFDFSEYEIISRKFYNPHNVGYALLKFSFFWYFFMLFLLLDIKKVKNEYHKVFLSLIILYLTFNIGFGIKSSALLGLLISLKKFNLKGQHENN